MPAAALGEDETANLVAYLRSLEPKPALKTKLPVGRVAKGY